ncbi:MAG: enoyl-CoA hydratase-related protein [Pseudomonadales bacterium]|jgi:enoyl-CoA hydratase/carnithine racemase|nr:enoyl-CoA hydratase-related protein [Pseudomonadales bacterium]MDP6470534.1 enoyl-CoA hydratase-related protein [Pseudomonadales bacterium]MDP6827836.1 enoyl-CoA hydratase-related protein [Pseudomonadales bacterium]MDP6972168.1 enoyl-CoA hydratase-related protein [Pseudomonadales bacterium]|tara:strand:- start:2399 stop:3232 length:834 start_codon:yes stop_codon:yes gene_type:complete
MYEEIRYEVSDPVATITMNRPDALNAFTNCMLVEIRHALGKAEKDERVVGIALTGEGRGFCAGMDMNALNFMPGGKGAAGGNLSALEAHPGDPDPGPNFQVTFSYLMSIRKPLIAAINGACKGLGFVFAMLCEMRFVQRQAKFTTAFSQRELITKHGVSWILPRLAGPGRALDLLWSTRKFTGEETQQPGLAEHLVETGEAPEAAVGYISELESVVSPTSLKVIKAQVYRHLNMQLGKAMAQTNTWMAESLERDDFREGVRCFMERRPPAFDRIKAE